MSGHFGLFFLVMWPIIAAFICYSIGRYRKKMRDYFAIFAVILELGVTVAVVFEASNISPPTFELMGFMGHGIHLVMDGLRGIYAVIAALMWMMTTIFSREYFAHYRNRNRYYFFTLLTLGGTMGVFLSADLITTFLFFEIMSFTSYVMVIHDEKPKAIDASKTYMAVAVIGGLSMLFGIFLIRHLLGTTEIAALFDAIHSFEGNTTMLYVAAIFMLIGFGGKAGMYPIHIWLPNAHPAAPAPASALLSGILTKTGVFGILLISAQIFFQDTQWGFLMLILGLLGMFTGALLALFSIDLKRILAYSSVSQIGFIMLGIGVQGIIDAKYTPLAIQGTMLHMVNHSLIKLVLFMMAGVVYVNLHQLDLNKIRGFGRGKPLFTFSFLMGALAIIGVPLWSGYVSKKLLQKSISYHITGLYDDAAMSLFFQGVEGIFILTGGMTTAYMIKIFVCVCLERNQFNQERMTRLNRRYIAKASLFALLASTMLLPVLGFNPNLFMKPIARFGQTFMQGVDYYTTIDLFEGATLMGALPPIWIGLILYFFIIRGCLMGRDEANRKIYLNVWPPSLDIEKKIYKPVFLRVLPFIGAMIARTYGSIISGIVTFFFRALQAAKDFWAADHDIPGYGLQILRSIKSYNDEMSAAIFTNTGSGVWNTKLYKKAQSSGGLFGSLAFSILLCLIGILLIFVFVLLF